MKTPSVRSLLARGKTLEQKGDIAGAQSLYSDILKRYPGNKPSQAALKNLLTEGLDTSKKKVYSNEDEIFKNALENFTNENYLEVAAQLEEVLTKLPTSLRCWHLLGHAHSKLGQHAKAVGCFQIVCERNPHAPECKKDLGNALMACNRFKDATTIFRAAINLAPNPSELYFLLGLALYSSDQVEEAKGAYESALEFNPNFFEAHLNLGAIHKAKGDLVKAKHSYNKSLEINPKNAMALSNLGAVYAQENLHSEAKKIYLTALEIAPNSAQTHNNLGASLKILGELPRAIGHYQRALELDGNYLDAEMNLMRAYIYAEDFSRALEVTKSVLSKDIGNVQGCRALVKILEKCAPAHHDPELHSFVLALLQQQNLFRPSSIAKAVIAMIRLDPRSRSIFDHQRPQQNAVSLQTLINELCEQELLLTFMQVSPLPDMELESFLASCRSKILDGIDTLGSIENIGTVLEALSLHCFTNEHVWYATPEEESKVDTLIERAQKRLTGGEDPTTELLLCISLYRELRQIPEFEELNLGPRFTKLQTHLISNAIEENRITIQIKSLSNITDNVSIKVREQYEQSPYPRWIQTKLPETTMTVRDLIDMAGLKLPIANVKAVSTNAPRILVAGAGTGQHAISTAARYENCSVVALDISKRSLAYGIRKAQEMQIENLTFFHADLLDLSALKENFDIIECVGVLHHLNDPMRGWEELITKLRPDGLMRIGLYSTIARRHIATTRRELNLEEKTYSLNDMKATRLALCKSDTPHHRAVSNIGDFYTLSSFRDLIFHAQEHTFTLLEIKTNLLNLGLEFCGFEDQRNLRDSKNHGHLNNGVDQQSLDDWHKYECAHPDTFLGMYQFWCQKSVGA